MRSCRDGLQESRDIVEAAAHRGEGFYRVSTLSSIGHRLLEVAIEGDVRNVQSFRHEAG
jgi:hypothetical protein